MEHLQAEDVWITGIGLVSSLGEGQEEHWRRLTNGSNCTPVVDDTSFAPYPVHPLVETDFSKQIPKRGDLRQMGQWQRLGVYAAGLALTDAGVAEDPDCLDRMDMIVAANGGERDVDVDDTILHEMSVRNDPDAYFNEALSTQLRPTLFLAQLPNLMSGNISIVHKVAGSSRTFMGEEMAGVCASQTALRRIRAGQSEICLIGGAYNAERDDMQFLFELGRYLWSAEYRPVWERHKYGGGLITGSVGAFLVLEAKSHAQARGATPYARVHDILADRCTRKPGAAAENARKQFDSLRDHIDVGPLPVLSGSCGAEPITSEECWFLRQLEDEGYGVAARAIGSIFGHSVEAHFPASLALAAISASRRNMFPPFAGSSFEKPHDGATDRVLVTGWGYWRGEGLALVESVH